jgi:2-polyprenyl-6-hydroxyphenyl methylase / 3-demethylubiquinone-9 3-methyltransferase
LAADNTIYDRDCEHWWSGEGHLALLGTLLPARLEFLGEAVTHEGLGTLDGKRVLDVGCGGGMFSEELAKLGAEVTGVDPSAKSIEAGRAHAAAGGLDITYEHGHGEQLPFDDGRFDLVVCCDVLEHVDDLDTVMAETSRVLKPGGLYLYDTVNRTWVSKLFVIHLFQEWSWTRLVPSGLHDWDSFIRPEEMETLLVAHGLRPARRSGLAPSLGPLVSARRLWDLYRLKTGRLDHASFARGMLFAPSPIELTNYIGCAIKDG